MTSDDLLDRIWDDRRHLDKDKETSVTSAQATHERTARDNADFIDAYRSALRDAEKVVMSRQERGEHDTIPLSQVFVHGLSDITFLLLVKARRLIALEKGQKVLNIEELKEEATDVINYSALLVALLDRMQ